MKRSIVSHSLVFALLTGFVGCGGSGSTVDTKPTAPPVTADSVKDLTKDINSQKGTMGPGGAAPKK